MRYALVTGASTGIGRDIALTLDRSGWSVFAGYRKSADADALRSAGSDRLVPLRLDVTEEADIAAAADVIGTTCGPAGLSGLVNNAGIAVGKPLEALTTDELRWQFEVNVFGLHAVTRALLPAVRTATGRIVNVSSIAGRISNPITGPYAASKHAVEALTAALRQELVSEGMWVASVLPGVVATPIWDKAQAAAESTELPDDLEARYRPFVETMTRRIRKAPEVGVAPRVVTDAVVHALTAQRPRPHYLCGSDARTGNLLRTLLPTWAFERVIRKVMWEQ